MTTVEQTHRWRLAFGFTLFTSAAGLYLEAPVIFLTSLIGVVYAGYPHLVGPPTVNLELSRTVTDKTPDHGDPVTVTVTVTNAGSQTLVDLRIMDGVPSLLTVSDGTARHTATLRPDVSTTFQYTVTAKHGSHQFTPATVIAHDISGQTRIETTVAAGEQTTVRQELECTVDLRAFQLRRQARQYPGQTTANTGGSGLEFQQTRAYQRVDPMNRIDWKSYARTGELTTIEFREERRTAVVLCLDARPDSIRAAAATDPHAVAYCVAAAQEVLSVLEEQSEQVGVAIFGTEFEWLAPSAGRQQYAQIEDLLVDYEYDQSNAIKDIEASTTSTASLQQLLTQAQGNLEILVFSPLLDPFGETVVQQLDTHGHAVTVISPDVTTDRTVSGEYIQVERMNRVQLLRNNDVPVANWSPEDPLRWPVNCQRGIR